MLFVHICHLTKCYYCMTFMKYYCMFMLSYACHRDMPMYDVTDVCFLMSVFLQQNEKSAMLIRQYVKHSLYDRISTRPFLSSTEKCWIAFQLLCALNQCHKAKVLSICYDFSERFVRRSYLCFLP